MKRVLVGLGIILVLGFGSVALADTTDTSTYGSGAYGNCDFGSCSITLTSSGSVSLSTTPNGSGLCSVASGTASVLTDNPGGYTLVLANSSTNTNMTDGAHNVAASAGSAASPIMLAANTWGYRVDGLSGFGAGPSSSGSNIATPSLTFAGVPASNATAATLANTAAPANPAAVTTVWYGMCVNTAIPSGTYTTQVTYTATTN